MFKQIATALVIFLALSACGDNQEPVDLSGQWITDDQDDFRMFADISAENGFEIVLVTEDMTALYWKGSAPETATSGDIFTSEGNTAVMDASLFGSGLDVKDFKYENDKISYEFTILGTTRTLYLERV